MTRPSHCRGSSVEAGGRADSEAPCSPVDTKCAKTINFQDARGRGVSRFGAKHSGEQMWKENNRQEWKKKVISFHQHGSERLGCVIQLKVSD